MTRVQRIQQTDAYKSGDWFTAAVMAQSVRMPVDEIRTVLAQEKEDFDHKRVSGKALVYRKKKPAVMLKMRTRRYEFENDYTPRWY